MPETVKNAENIMMEPCDVIYDSQNLGFTHEPTKVALTSEYREIYVQQKLAPVDKVLMKRTCKVTVSLAEHSLALLEKCVPGSRLITDELDPLKKRLDISAESISLLSYGKPLQLMPQSGKTNRIFNATKAVPSGNIEYSFDKDNESYFAVEFECLADGNGFVSLGDPDAMEAE